MLYLAFAKMFFKLVAGNRQAIIGFDATFVHRILVRMDQRNRLIRLLEVGKTQAGNPPNRVDGKFKPFLEIRDQR